MLACCINELTTKVFHCVGLTAEDEGALQQTAFDQTLQFGSQSIGTIRLAVAVLLDLLVGIGAVLVGDLFAAINLRSQIINFRSGTANQENLVLRLLVSRLIHQACKRGVVVLRINKLDDGLNGIAITRQRHRHTTLGLRLESGLHGQRAM
ncbi:hypothetical protein FQZ97_850140 [compost metagenome]